MKFSTVSDNRVVRILASLRFGPVLILLVFAALGSYALLDTHAHSGGITGQTQKSTTAGCSCHCPSSSSSTSVSLTTGSGTSPLTATPSTAYTFTATISNSSESAGGIDIASYSGSGLTPGTGLQNGVSPNTSELTQTTAKSISGGTVSWTFTYTTASTSGWDTLYATGNAVNGDGSNTCADEWNQAPKFIIHTVAPSVTKRFSLGRTSINLGQVRVGTRKADSLLVSSTGATGITIQTNGMKSGAPFTFYNPGSTPRTINNGSTEVDSVIFTPTSRGTFNDSIIYTSNSDTIPDTRKGLAVTAQGIQAVFSPSTGSLAFGNLRIYRTATMAFPFTNTGDDIMFYSTPAISGTGFTISQAPHSTQLSPGSYDTVIVKFSPTTQTTFTGSLTFSASNGVSAPSISLSGAGITPTMQYSATQNIGGSRVGTSLSGSVTFRNTGNDTLHLSNLSLTQSASKFTLGAYDAAVAPGASGTIHISYLPNAERSDSATVHLTTDDAANATPAILVIAAGVTPHMSLVDHDTVDMGTIKFGDQANRNFTINNNGGDVLNAHASTGGAPFTINGATSATISAGATGFFTVTFNPAAVGSFKGSLIVTGDDPNNPADTIPLKGSAITSSLTITPASVDFGAVPVGTTVFDTINMSNTGSAAVKIFRYSLLSISPVFGAVDTSANVVNGNGTARIILSFTPANPTSYSGVLTLSTDDNNAPSRTINLSGSGIKGALSATPTSLDFGTVDSGKVQMLQTVFHNTGSAAVAVSSIAVAPTGTAFSDSIGHAVSSIAAGDSVKVFVMFAPIAGGVQSASLNANLTDGTKVSVALTGTGHVKPSGGSGGVAADELRTFALTLSPNPAKDLASVRVQLQDDVSARLRVFDAAGREVQTTTLGRLNIGEHVFDLVTNGWASGTYFVRLECSNGAVGEGRLSIER